MSKRIAIGLLAFLLAAGVVWKQSVMAKHLSTVEAGVTVTLPSTVDPDRIAGLLSRYEPRGYSELFIPAAGRHALLASEINALLTMNGVYGCEITDDSQVPALAGQSVRLSLCLMGMCTLLLLGRIVLWRWQKLAERAHMKLQELYFGQWLRNDAARIILFLLLYAACLAGMSAIVWHLIRFKLVFPASMLPEKTFFDLMHYLSGAIPPFAPEYRVPMRSLYRLTILCGALSLFGTALLCVRNKRGE